MLTKRLDMIVSHIDANAKTVADIGTDHAYIPIKLALDGRAERIIATDMNKGPLKSADRNVGINGCKDRVECRLGDGLSPLKNGECEIIVIAGMGGELIASILTEGEQVAKSAQKILLQPMNAQAYLRKFLAENGYNIVEEDLAVEGFKVYNLIVAEKGEMPLPESETELHLPRSLYKNRCFEALVKKKKREFSKILYGLERAKERNDAEIERYTRLLNETEKLEEEYAGR